MTGRAKGSERQTGGYVASEEFTVIDALFFVRSLRRELGFLVFTGKGSWA